MESSSAIEARVLAVFDLLLGALEPVSALVNSVMKSSNDGIINTNASDACLKNTVWIGQVSYLSRLKYATTNCRTDNVSSREDKPTPHECTGPQLEPLAADRLGKTSWGRLVWQVPIILHYGKQIGCTYKKGIKIHSSRKLKVTLIHWCRHGWH